MVRGKVPEVRSNWITKVGEFFGGIFALAGSLFNGILGNIAAAREYVRPLQDAAAGVPGWAWLALLAFVAAGLYLVARHGEQKRIEAFQSGERR